MSRVLITGVAGFLGARLARRMVLDGWDVVGLDLVPRVDAWRLEGVDLEYRWGSCEDLRRLDAPYVVHCASQGDVPLGISSPAYTIHQNMHGTLAVLEAAREYDGLSQLILQSSEEVYGHCTNFPIKEETPLSSANLYGATKAAQELMAMAYWHSYDLPVTILRSATLTGESMRRTQVIPIFLEQALRGDSLTIHGDGTQTRDFHWVDDHVDAILAALFTPFALRRVINVGSGVERSVLSIADECIRVTGSKSNLQFVAQRPGEQDLRLVLDITRAREVLGYTPKVSFEEGLERMATWLAKELGVTPSPKAGSLLAAATVV